MQITLNVISKFENEWSFLSNFWSSPITIDWDGLGLLTYPTGEHAFQAAKSKAMPLGASHKTGYIHGVQKAGSPKQAKYLGRSVKLDLDTWESIKIRCMREVVFTKFTDQELKAQLLSTGHAMLVEGNTWGDTFWGRCDGKGSNILGSILMEVRGYWWWVNDLNQRGIAGTQGQP